MKTNKKKDVQEALIQLKKKGIIEGFCCCGTKRTASTSC